METGKKKGQHSYEGGKKGEGGGCWVGRVCPTCATQSAEPGLPPVRCVVCTC